jgi:hypothetical protein
MSDKQTVIRLPEVTPLDKLSLQKHLSSEEIDFEKPSTLDDEHGEPVTVVAVVVVSVNALAALTYYLLRKYRKKTFRIQVERTNPDGSKENINIEYEAVSSDPPEQAMIKEIASKFNVDLDALTKAFSSLRASLAV